MSNLPHISILLNPFSKDFKTEVLEGYIISFREDHSIDNKGILTVTYKDLQGLTKQYITHFRIPESPRQRVVSVRQHNLPFPLPTHPQNQSNVDEGFYE